MTQQVQIGDPDVAALARVLDHGRLRERRCAVHARNLINSVSAKSALRQHVNREPDKVLRDDIRKILALNTLTIPGSAQVRQLGLKVTLTQA